MFIELHAPNGTAIFHNVNQIIAVGLDDLDRTNIFYDNSTFVVEETVSTVMGLIEQAKRHSMAVVN